MRKLIVAFAAICSLTAPAALAQSALPDKIALPNGFAPEGIEIAGGKTFYVGSTQTGAIYSGSLRTGVGRILIPGAAAGTRAATGIEYEHGKLWVAGAAGGTARVYDVKTRALVREYHLAPAASTFINDVVVTKDAAYFTDSQRPVISRIAHRPRRRAGCPHPHPALGRLPPPRRSVQSQRDRGHRRRQAADRRLDGGQEALPHRPGDRRRRRRSTPGPTPSSTATA